MEQFKRKMIIPLRSDVAEKSGDAFHIVVYHRGSALDYAFQGIPIATEVRNKHFHPASRHFLI
jgi:hypothetical protein